MNKIERGKEKENSGSQDREGERKQWFTRQREREKTVVHKMFTT